MPRVLWLVGSAAAAAAVAALLLLELVNIAGGCIYGRASLPTPLSAPRDTVYMYICVCVYICIIYV